MTVVPRAEVSVPSADLSASTGIAQQLAAAGAQARGFEPLPPEPRQPA